MSVRAGIVAIITALAGLAPGQTPSLPPASAMDGAAPGDFVSSEGDYDGHVADWGYLAVSEHRGKEGSRLLRLVVVRERALERAERPPIFNLVGGPGASNVWGSGQIPEALMARRDVVRVGYRGIDSNVELTCPECTVGRQGEAPLSDAGIEKARAALRACADRLRAEGVDLEGYTLSEVVDDIEDARHALGYDRISFVAASFGTQIALSYTTRYPNRVDRMFLVGAGGQRRGLDLCHASHIDGVIRQYAALWAQEEDARARSDDIVATIRSVLNTLPQTWRGVHIDPGTVRLGTWYMLRESRTAAQVLDAFAEAAGGDLAGLALMSWGFDAELDDELTRRFGPYHGEFFSKAASALPADAVIMDDTDNSIIGSPAARYMWGVIDAWPIARAERQIERDCDVPTLILHGKLDIATPIEYVELELMPHLSRGHLVAFDAMGHMDVATLQPDAFAHAMTRWFEAGAVDTSRYVPNQINFSPRPGLSDMARSLIAEPPRQ